MDDREERRKAREARIKALEEEERRLAEERQKRLEGLKKAREALEEDLKKPTSPPTPAPASTPSPALERGKSTVDVEMEEIKRKTEERKRKAEEQRRKQEEEQQKEDEERAKRAEERKRERERRMKELEEEEEEAKRRREKKREEDRKREEERRKEEEAQEEKRREERKKEAERRKEEERQEEIKREEERRRRREEREEERRKEEEREKEEKRKREEEKERKRAGANLEEDRIKEEARKEEERKKEEARKEEERKREEREKEEARKEEERKREEKRQREEEERGKEEQKRKEEEAKEEERKREEELRKEEERREEEKRKEEKKEEARRIKEEKEKEEERTKKEEGARREEEQKQEEERKRVALKKEEKRKEEEERREEDRKQKEAKEEEERKQVALKKEEEEKRSKEEERRREEERKQEEVKKEEERKQAALKEDEEKRSKEEETRREEERKREEAKKEEERKQGAMKKEEEERKKEEEERKEEEAKKEEERRQANEREEKRKKEEERKQEEKRKEEEARKEEEGRQEEEKRKREEEERKQEKEEERRVALKKEDEEKKRREEEARKEEERKQEEAKKEEERKQAALRKEEEEKRKKEGEARKEEERKREEAKKEAIKKEEEEKKRKEEEARKEEERKQAALRKKEEEEKKQKEVEEESDEESEEEEEKGKDKHKKRTPEDVQRRKERKERKQKEREAQGLGPETKEERKARREDRRKHKAEKLEKKEQKLKQKEDKEKQKEEKEKAKESSEAKAPTKKIGEGIASRLSAMGGIPLAGPPGKPMGGGGSFLRPKPAATSSTPSTSSTDDSTAPPKEEEPDEETHDSTGKISTIVRVKGQAGRRLPTRANRASMRVTSSSESKTESAAPQEERKTVKGGSILDVAIKAHETEKEKMLKRLGETGRPSSAPSARASYVPPGASPLFNGLASLALEAVQKKQSASAEAPVIITRQTTFEERRARRQSTPLPQTVKMVEENSSLPSANYRASLKQTTDAPARMRLVHAKGKKRIHIKEVEPSLSSLNKSDTFVLDCGIASPTIFVWNGPKSSPAKKSKGAALAEILKNHERSGHATIVKLDSFSDDPAFWAALGGGSAKDVQENWPFGTDEDAEKLWAENMKLYKVIIGALVSFDQVPFKQLGMDLLSSESFYVLDCETEVYLWIGKLSNMDKRAAVISAVEEVILPSDGRKKWVELAKVPEGGEPVLFREKFVDWPDLSHDISVRRMGLGGPRKHEVFIPYERRTHEKMLKFSTSSLLTSEYEPPEIKTTGEGELEIWKVDGASRVAIRTDRYGHFFASNTYIITHTYYPRGAIRHMVVVWQGATCSKNEAGSATLLIKDIVRDLSKTAETTQEVVQQQRASVQFFSLFSEKKVVVHFGEEGEKPPMAMFQIHGYVPARVHAEMMDPQACWLNSRDAFVVVGAGNAYLWIGAGASPTVIIPNAKTIAKKIALFYSISDYKVVQEGSEPDQFWKLIGGKQPYANMPYLADPKNTFVPRLFAISNTGTILRADEVYDFQQVDLAPVRVVILDTGIEVFVWTGAKSPEKEKKRGMEIALEYVELQSRSADSVLLVNQGEEPPSFTAHFHPWAPFSLPSSALSSAAAKTASPLKAPSSPSKHASQELEKYAKKYPYAFLKQKNTPPEVDRAVLENYLTPEDFPLAFKISHEAFMALPNWKKIELKKTAELF